jgi:hypothetical protein
MGRLPLITYDTVLWETPATRATSLLVNAGIKHLLTAPSIRIAETPTK